MAQGRVVVLNEVRKGEPGDWQLCFQRCRYEYNDAEGSPEQEGYRFIWRRPNGNLQGARGQARIPSIADIMELTAAAVRGGWAHYMADEDGYGSEGGDE